MTKVIRWAGTYLLIAVAVFAGYRAAVATIGVDDPGEPWRQQPGTRFITAYDTSPVPSPAPPPNGP